MKTPEWLFLEILYEPLISLKTFYINWKGDNLKYIVSILPWTLPDIFMNYKSKPLYTSSNAQTLITFNSCQGKPVFLVKLQTWDGLHKAMNICNPE